MVYLPLTPAVWFSPPPGSNTLCLPVVLSRGTTWRHAATLGRLLLLYFLYWVTLTLQVRQRVENKRPSVDNQGPMMRSNFEGRMHIFDVLHGVIMLISRSLERPMKAKYSNCSKAAVGFSLRVPSFLYGLGNTAVMLGSSWDEKESIEDTMQLYDFYSF